MRTSLAALALTPALLLAGCGGSGGDAPQSGGQAPPSAAPTVEQEAPTVPAGPTPAQFDQAKKLGAELGCPNLNATPSGGAANGAVDAECDRPAPAGDFASQWDYQITVFPDAPSAQAYLQTLRASYSPNGVAADNWLVTTSVSEAVSGMQAKIGGQQL
jgi:hypothetical protein